MTSKEKHDQFFPPFPYRGPSQKVWGVLRWRALEETVRIVIEGGEFWDFPANAQGYARCATLMCERGLYIITEFRNGTNPFPWMIAALGDYPRTVIMANPKKGATAIRVKRGHRVAYFITGATWLAFLPEGIVAADAVTVMRNVVDRLDVGAQTSPSGIGMATLNRYITKNNILRIVRQDGTCQAEMLKYLVGGMVKDPQVGFAIERAYENDINQAFPTAAKNGVPDGKGWRSLHEPPYRAGRPVFGTYFIRVSEDIPISPVPWKDRWEDHTERAEWSLAAGQCFVISCWQEQIEALRATGKATAEYRRGWVWERETKILAPWIEELTRTRDEFSQQGYMDEAKLTKQVANSTLGRFLMPIARAFLVPEQQAMVGEKLLQLANLTFSSERDDLPPTGVIRIDDRHTGAQPTHMGSYIVMKVIMELYRKRVELDLAGIPVIAVNIDSITLDREVRFSTPVFSYKTKLLREYVSEYSRAHSWTEVHPDGTAERRAVLPGTPRKIRGRVGRPGLGETRWGTQGTLFPPGERDISL